MKTKKLFSLLLCVVVLLGIMTIGAFAKTYKVDGSIPPKVDGVVGATEYDWTQSYSKGSTVDKENYVINADGKNEDTITYHMSYDDNYIYVAAVSKDAAGFPSSVWFCFDPSVGKTTRTGSVSLISYFDTSAEKEVVSELKANSIIRIATSKTAKTDSKKGTGGYNKYVVDAKTTWTSDETYTYVTVEVKFDREALAKYGGHVKATDMTTLGFRSSSSIKNSSSGKTAEVYFGDKTSDYPYYHQSPQPVHGFHVFNFCAHELSGTCTNIGKDYHTQKCSLCNKDVAVSHTIEETVTENATLTKEGKAQRVCSANCGYNPPDAVDYIPADGHLLGYYGQKNYFIPAAITAPQINGVVELGEYNMSTSVNVSDANADGLMDTVDNAAFYIPSGSNVNSTTKMSVHTSYDANKIYLAIVIDDAKQTEGDYTYIYIGSSNNAANRIRIYVPNYGAVNLRRTLEFACPAVSGATNDSMRNTYLPLLENDASSAVGSKDANKVTYEFAFDRAALCELAKSADGTTLDGIDKLYLGIEHSPNSNKDNKDGDKGYLYFGYNNSGFNYHALYLGERDVFGSFFAANHVTPEACTCTDNVGYIQADGGHKKVCYGCGKVDATATEHKGAKYGFVDVDYHTYLCACGVIPANSEMLGHTTDTPKYSSMNAKQHAFTCDLCGGNYGYADHIIDYKDFAPKPDLNNPGKATKYCTDENCKYEEVGVTYAPDAHLLTAYGQKHLFAGDSTAAIDGKISVGEYPVELIVANTDEDGDIGEDVRFYLGQNDEYIYVATAFSDNSNDGYGDVAWLCLLVDGLQYNFGIQRPARQGIECHIPGITNVSSTVAQSATAYAQKLIKTHVRSDNPGYYGNQTVYELAIKRSEFGVDFDKVGFAGAVVSKNNSKLTCGFTDPTGDLSAIYSTNGRVGAYHHAFFLGAKAEYKDFLTTYGDWYGADCEHKEAMVVSVDDEGHTDLCKECGLIAKVEHFYPSDFADNGDGTHSAECPCGYANTGKHTAAQYEDSKDGRTHKANCEVCGEEFTELHAKVETEITPATATEPGEMKITCKKCKYVKTEEIPAGTTGGGIGGGGFAPVPDTEAPDIEAPETESPVTDAPDTDAPVTEAPVTEAPETEAPLTEAPETEAPVTEEPETEAPAKTDGCNGSITAMGIALVAMLGTCTAFVSKKKED